MSVIVRLTDPMMCTPSTLSVLASLRTFTRPSVSAGGRERREEVKIKYFYAESATHCEGMGKKVAIHAI